MSDRAQMEQEAALVVLVPEAERLVGSFRAQHDPAAAQGVPAHITINYPFLPGIHPSEDLLRDLKSLFGDIPSFTFQLTEVARFPDVIYLPPEPGEPFRQLIETVAARFPESPPYGGVFDEVIPHLTVAQSDDEALLHTVESDFSEISLQELPIESRVEGVWLMDNRGSRWEKRELFRLSGV